MQIIPRRASQQLPGVLVAAAVLGCLSRATSGQSSSVSAPPETLFQLVRERDRDTARAFYRKHLDMGGVPVVAADVVEDAALLRTQEIVTHLLAGRPDVVRAMVENGMYLIIIGRDQVYTDMPEYRLHPNPAFQNERVRGTGGKPTSFGEENLLSLPLDRYDDESIAVHEFCHTIDGALRSLDPEWTARRNATFAAARKQGLFEKSYAGSNAGEYWAEICQAYFDCNRVNNWNHGPIGTREQLQAYDPAGYELVRSTFRLSPDQDWRYSFARKLPNVTSPPKQFDVPSYYTKFTWAREFKVVGREASDAALLTANDTIRKMFAYRHDILKALMAAELKLVVLGRDESIANLPEYEASPDKGKIDALVRCGYVPELKLLIAGEENLGADPRQPGVGDNHVVRSFACAIYQRLAARPVDEQWQQRPRNVWQQYELGVERVDQRLGEKLNTLFGQATSAGKWMGTPAIHDAQAYWVCGVLAYFDAADQQPAPRGSRDAITSREALREYDPELAALVHESFAYDGRVDWRLRP